MTTKTRTLAVVLLAITICGACARAPRAGGNSNTPSANASDGTSQAAAEVSPLVRQTVRGDLERAGLEVDRALNSAKTAEWQVVVYDLQNANKHVDAGLARNITYSQREGLEGLKSAIQRTIQVVESRDKEAASQLAEVRTRISALKVMIPES